MPEVDWENCKKKYSEFWACENHDKPLVWVTAPEDNIDFDAIELHQPTQNTLNWMTGPYYFRIYTRNCRVISRIGG